MTPASPAQLIEVVLPGGLFVQGSRHQQAVLRPLRGADEALLEDQDGSVPRMVTRLLTRCLTRLGPHRPATTEHVLGLTVGDRDALLLHLRRATLGDRLECVIDCPRPACAEKLETEVSIQQLLLPPYLRFKPVYSARPAAQGKVWDLTFRLPTGADQEAASEAPDAASAMRRLLENCLVDIRTSGARRKAKRCPEEVMRALSDEMEQLDPQADLSLNAVCPNCGVDFAADLDIAGFFLRELRQWGCGLDRQVHQLAFHYHWSEREILHLPLRRRHRYLALIAEQTAVRSL